MFAGTCHLINGNMLCGVCKNSLALRLGRKQRKTRRNASASSRFKVTAKPVKGWIMIAANTIDQASFLT
ncbi:MAG: hypothetical protein JSW48_11640 [Betaproteobacteria bacterium]|jgi:hypothetical protein|nr:MAG: hypothetical protein JSW48_11640 [Betaproteobacteria bacterium]